MISCTVEPLLIYCVDTTATGPRNVPSLERCPYFRGWFVHKKYILLGPQKLSWLERCPYFRGVLSLNYPMLHCTYRSRNRINTILTATPTHHTMLSISYNDHSYRKRRVDDATMVGCVLFPFGVSKGLKFYLESKFEPPCPLRIIRICLWTHAHDSDPTLATTNGSWSGVKCIVDSVSVCVYCVCVRAEEVGCACVFACFACPRMYYRTRGLTHREDLQIWQESTTISSNFSSSEIAVHIKHVHILPLFISIPYPHKHLLGKIIYAGTIILVLFLCNNVCVCVCVCLYL